MDREEPLLIVLDAANIIGSRPDGWWRDRAGAARRLLTALPGGLGEEGEVVAVVEGQARLGIPEDIDERVLVVAASGSGDDEIVRIVREVGPPGRAVLVVTSDRDLRERVEALGAETVGPHWFWDHLAAGDDERDTRAPEA